MKPILTAREVRALQGELARAILKAQRSADPYYRDLYFIQQAWGRFEDSLALAKRLRSPNREVRRFASLALRFCGDVRVVPALLRAARAPENAGYARPYVWACAHFDCTPYLAAFLSFIIRADDAGSVAWASLAVLERMQGPFDKATLTRYLRTLLRCKLSDSTSHVLLHELLLAKTGKLLHNWLYEVTRVELEISRLLT
ncbi:MAG: hypothetical protein EOO60_08140 [Hymenobacter sp.]|nr:MAG: hypothetical protein EOO60_08140 [Hymenobacter sp.]